MIPKPPKRPYEKISLEHAVKIEPRKESPLLRPGEGWAVVRVCAIWIFALFVLAFLMSLAG